MPKINDYSVPELGRQSEGQSSNASLSSGAGLGRSMAQFGAQLADIGDAVYRRQAQEELSDLNAKFAEARSEWAQRIDDEARAGTIDTQKVQTDYQDYINKMNEGIQTSEGRNYFESQSGRLNAYVMRSSGRAQAVVAGEKAVANYTSALNSDANLLQRKPGDFNEVLSASLESIDQQVSSGLIDAGVGEKLRLATNKELSKNAVRGLIEQNPYRAKQELDKGAYDKYLDSDTKAQLYNSLQSELERRQIQSEKNILLKEKDPWKFISRAGDTAGLKPVSLGENAGRSFQDRAEFIANQNQKHGINLPFLSDSEAEAISLNLASANPTEAVQLFNNLDTNIPDKQRAAFALPIFKKDPTLAATIMIAGDAPDDARKIMAGGALLKSGGEGVGSAIKPPKEADIQSYFDSYVGNSVEDPVARQSARMAIKNHLVKSLFDRGDTDMSSITSGDFDESAKAILGPKVELNGMPALSFRGKSGKFLDEDEFETLVNSLSDKRVEAALGDVPRTSDGEPMNLQKSTGRISLKSIGDGKYFVIRDGREVALKKDRNQRQPYFVLDLKAIEKIPFAQKDQFSDPGRGGYGAAL